MTLRDLRPGLRTLHNGSNAVAKASVIVPEGGELTVPDEVAVQLLAQASGAFKDGPAPVVVLSADEPEVEPQPADKKQARRK